MLLGKLSIKYTVFLAKMSIKKKFPTDFKYKSTCYFCGEVISNKKKQQHLK